MADEVEPRVVEGQLDSELEGRSRGLKRPLLVQGARPCGLWRSTQRRLGHWQCAKGHSPPDSPQARTATRKKNCAA